MSPEERAAELRHCALAAAGARGTHAGFVATLCRERAAVRAESKAEVEALTKRVAELERQLAVAQDTLEWCGGFA